jgi:hypothetical protein
MNNTRLFVVQSAQGLLSRSGVGKINTKWLTLNLNHYDLLAFGRNLFNKISIIPIAAANSRISV